MCPALQPDYTSITFSLAMASVLYPTETDSGYGFAPTCTTGAIEACTSTELLIYN